MPPGLVDQTGYEFINHTFRADAKNYFARRFREGGGIIKVLQI